MGKMMDMCSAEIKKMKDAIPSDQMSAADAAQKTEYDGKKKAWDADCATESGKSFADVADANGYKDSVSAMPASAWFTSAFGLLLAMAMLLMK